MGALHATKVIAGFEAVVAQLVTDYTGATRVVGEKWHDVLVFLIASGVAWLGLSNVPRWRTSILIGLLLVELFVLAWVCSLYRVFFQPTPSILALLFAFAAAEGWSAFLEGTARIFFRALFADRVSTQQFRRLGDGRISFETDPRTYEVSVVVCDIGNKLTFAEGGEPAAFTEATAKFIRETAASLVEQGAYLQAADGEGVVGIFGFPAPDPEHAQKATRVILDMIKNSRERIEDEEAAGTRDIRAGISSGAIIAGALQESRRSMLLASGEAIELARRFCVLNRFYGSRALMDTATFDRVNEAVVARPIDFVSGLNSHDRLEVYEPLWPAAEAGPERVAQRDSFWSGVVLYREKRWAEAYAEFQKARGSETEDDAPLQFYLRRLEPLLLQLTQWPVEGALTLVLRKTEYPAAIRDLIAQLRQMPGVGPRSAERIALWMIRARGDQPEQIARAITDTRQSIHACNLCGFFAANEICEICADPSRSTDLLCVIEQPTDILPLEKTGAFRGRYHALGGKISPLDHVAPEDLRINELIDRVDREKISEIIFALPADVEGEATTNYIVDLLKDKSVALTRIARGIPAGGGLESADELTLSAALSGRTKL